MLRNRFVSLFQTCYKVKLANLAALHVDIL